MKDFYKNTPVLFALAVLLSTSCVPNRKVTYLQYGDELKHQNLIVTDSIIRVYESGELRYTLQPNDVLDIRIASPTPEEYNPFSIADQYITSGSAAGGNVGGGNNMQNRGYRIDPRGSLNLPVIGMLLVEGLTLEQLEDTIDVLAAVELEDPVTRINLMNFRFAVMGEVGNEGVQYSSDQSLTMMQAIAMAGGPDEFGDISRVKVIRRIDEKNYIFYVNLLDESFLSSEFYFVHPQDMIVIPPLRSRTYFKYLSPNMAIIASAISLTLTIISLFTLYNN